jgi:hypothetical protein
MEEPMRVLFALAALVLAACADVRPADGPGAAAAPELPTDNAGHPPMGGGLGG